VRQLAVSERHWRSPLLTGAGVGYVKGVTSLLGRVLSSYFDVVAEDGGETLERAVFGGPRGDIGLSLLALRGGHVAIRGVRVQETGC